MVGCISHTSLFSQPPFVDSLKILVGTTLPDTAKIDAINNIVFTNAINYPQYTIPFSDIAIQKSQTLEDSFRLSRSYNRKAIAFYFMGDYNSALDYYFKSLQISEKLKDPVSIATDYNNIGLVLLEDQIFDEALIYFQKSKVLIESTDRKDLLARVLDNIGIAHYSLQQNDEALLWFEKSLKINRELNQRQTMASNIKNVGNVFMQRENYKMALTHFKLALEIYEELDIKLEIAGLLNKIAFVSAKLGKYSESEQNLIRAKDLIDIIGSQTLLLENIKVNAQHHELTGNYKKAALKWNSYNHLKDSIQQTDREKNYQQLKALVETNEKIKDLELYRKLNAVQREEIRSQKVIQTGVVILLFLSLLVLVLIVNALRTKNRTNKLLEKLVEERTSELKIAKEQAEKSDKLKTAFLENISHEVRTPMNAIVGFSDLLMTRNYDEEEKNDILKNMSQSTLRLLNLFEKISLLAQLENNEVQIIKSRCNIEELFVKLRDKYFQRLNDCELSVNINYHIPETLRVKDFVLPTKTIEEIIDELLDNSTKFTSKGLVSFGVNQENGEFLFYVKDTGQGIGMDEIDRIFDKFVKFNSSHCNMCDGAGIGLTIVKKNVELLGGKIFIESKPEEGTVVEFTIPYSS
jgi:signal transduction histidine kinase